MKKILSIIIIVLFVGCKKGDDVSTKESVTNGKISRIFASERIEDENQRLISHDIVELQIEDGTYISTLKTFPPLQAKLHYDFAYLRSTNQLLLRYSVYEGTRDKELIKLEIDKNEEETIERDVFGNMIVSKTNRLFAIRNIVEDIQVVATELVEVDPTDGRIVNILKRFDEIEENPNNDPTGVTTMFYSYETDEVIIPRRVSFLDGAVDDVFKIEVENKQERIIKTQHYQTMITANGRLFGTKYVFDSGTNSIKAIALVEVDMFDGSEVLTLGKFENSIPWEYEMQYSAQTNEIIFVQSRFRNKVLIRVNIDSKEISETLVKDYRTIRIVNIN